MVSIVDIGSILTPIIDRVFPDPKDKMELEEKLAGLADAEAAREHDEVQGQIQVDTTEAGNSNLFVAGWRPFVGWVCGAGFAYTFVLEPVMEFIAKVCHYSGSFPTLDTQNLMTLLMGMLGMGYMRMNEKINGVADSQVAPVAQAVVPVVQAAKKKLGGLWPF